MSKRALLIALGTVLAASTLYAAEIINGAINDRGTFFTSSTDDSATYCRWIFPASKKKVRASIGALDSDGRPQVAMPAE